MGLSPASVQCRQRCPALTQDAQLEVFGLLPHGVGCNAGVVAGTGQVGLEDLQEGSIWRNVVGPSPSQQTAIFEPRDLGLWVACKQREQAGESSAGFDQVGLEVGGCSRKGLGTWILHLSPEAHTPGQDTEATPSLSWALS